MRLDCLLADRTSCVHSSGDKTLRTIKRRNERMEIWTVWTQISLQRNLRWCDMFGSVFGISSTELIHRVNFLLCYCNLPHYVICHECKSGLIIFWCKIFSWTDISTSLREFQFAWRITVIFLKVLGFKVIWRSVKVWLHARITECTEIEIFYLD